MHDRKEICRQIAQELLREFDNSGFPVKPPIPVERVAEWLGYQTVMLNFVPAEFSAMVSTKEKLIGVNARHHRHRQRFSICHELAHILLKHPPESRCTRKQIAQFNVEADECASELLIPSDMLAHYLRDGRSRSVLIRIFVVSEEALIRKLEVLKTVGEGTHKLRNRG